MAALFSSLPNTLFLLLLLLLIHSLFFLNRSTAEFSIGVNYGTVADNLPPPEQVAAFIKEKTSIDKVKIFDANPDIIRAFGNSNVSLTISVANSDLVAVCNPDVAREWVANNVLPFYPLTKIKRICVGNEVLYRGDKNLIAHLVPAMKSIHSALKSAGIIGVQVSTPHFMGIFVDSEPPSSARFRRGYDRVIFRPMLQFHRRTKSPFLVCPYPFFGFNNRTLDYALFKPNPGIYDKATGFNYTNMFDAQMDAVYSAMKKLGYGDVEIVVAETGWPSAGDPGQPGVSLENAISYNANLVKHVNSGLGTPLMPNRTFETYIFSLFNENLKPGTSEKNFGLFRPDFSAVYDVGILRSDQSVGPSPVSPTAPAPTESDEKKWCVPRVDASESALQANIDFVCGSGLDCKPIQDGGPCFEPNNVRSHASFAMNAYFQYHGRYDYNCDFYGTGYITTVDPSYQECKYDA